MVKSFSGGNVPPGITPADAWSSFVLGEEYPAESVASWCDTCVHALTRDVSNWNEHGMYRTNLMAMSVLRKQSLYTVLGSRDAYPSIGSQRGAAPTTLTGPNGQSAKQPSHTSRSAHRCPLEVV